MGTIHSDCSNTTLSYPIQFDTENLEWINDETTLLAQINDKTGFFDVSQELKNKLQVTVDWLLLKYNRGLLEHAFEWHIIPLHNIPDLVFQTHEKEFCLPMAVKHSNKTLYLIVAYVDLGCICSLHFKVYAWFVQNESTVVLTESFWKNIDCVLRHVGSQWSKGVVLNQLDKIDVILKVMTMGYEEWRISVIGNSNYEEILDEVTIRPAVTLATQNHIPDWSHGIRDKTKSRHGMVPAPRTYFVREDIRDTTVEENTEDREPEQNQKRQKFIKPWLRQDLNKIRTRSEETEKHLWSLHSVYGTTIEYNELKTNKDKMDTYACSFETCVKTSIDDIIDKHKLDMLNTTQQWVKIEPFKSIVKPLQMCNEKTTSVIFAYKIDHRLDDQEKILYLLTFDIKMVHLHRDWLLDGGFPWDNAKLIEKTKEHSTITRWKIMRNTMVNMRTCHRRGEVATTIEGSNCLPTDSVINKTIIDKLSLFNINGDIW